MAPEIESSTWYISLKGILYQNCNTGNVTLSALRIKRVHAQGIYVNQFSNMQLEIIRKIFQFGAVCIIWVFISKAQGSELKAANLIQDHSLEWQIP